MTRYLFRAGPAVAGAPARSFLSCFSAFALVAALAPLGAGCIVEHDHYYAPSGPTNIEFEETRNLGAYCGSGLTSWTVANRETGDTATAGCEQPILFTNLTPNASYTFDVTGFVGSRLCFQGSCSVPTVAGTTAFADCSAQIAHLCGF